MDTLLSVLMFGSWVAGGGVQLETVAALNDTWYVVGADAGSVVAGPLFVDMMLDPTTDPGPPVVSHPTRIVYTGGVSQVAMVSATGSIAANKDMPIVQVAIARNGVVVAESRQVLVAQNKRLTVGSRLYAYPFSTQAVLDLEDGDVLELVVMNHTPSGVTAPITFTIADAAFIVRGVQ